MKTYQLLNELYNATNQAYPSKKIALRLRRMNYDHIYSFNEDLSKYVEGSAKYIKAVRKNRKNDLVKLFKTNTKYTCVGLKYERGYTNLDISKVTFTLTIKETEYDYDNGESYTYDVDVDYVLFVYQDTFYTGKKLIKYLDLNQEVIKESKAMEVSNDYMNDTINQYRFAEEMEVKVFVLNNILGHTFSTATKGWGERVATIGDEQYSVNQIKKMIDEYEKFTEWKTVEDDEYVVYSKRNGRIEKKQRGSSCFVTFLRVINEMKIKESLGIKIS